MKKKKFVNPVIDIIEILKDEIICNSNTTDPHNIMGLDDYDIYKDM